MTARRDPHTFSNPHEVLVRDLDLDLEIRFDRRVIVGQATLSLTRVGENDAPLILDTRGLSIQSVTARAEGERFSPASFAVGAEDPVLGAPLEIRIAKDTAAVRIRYETGPDATALQWLNPAQTAGGKSPFLFTQSEAIHARSWIPLQDTPSVRQTYRAAVRAPRGVTPLMSAGRVAPHEGVFHFAMPQAIPSYLIALAAGDLVYAPFTPRSGVWAEPSILEAAAAEFADTGTMIEAAEDLFGPYRWERYEILVLPPSFPYGGMENPRLTFATPTLLAGDRSLVDVVAHELAHSWSGNLVTNAAWDGFWLNEGFTTYCERRIVERVFGADRAEMEWVLGRRTLNELCRSLPVEDRTLRPDLAGRDPDAHLSELAYEKGALLLRTLEISVGRGRFDAFLRSWFDRFAFQSVTSDDFARFARENLADGSGAAPSVDVEAWLGGREIPSNAAVARSAALDLVDVARDEWVAGSRPVSALPWSGWSTLERLQFLRGLPETLPASRAAELDAALALSQIRNAEVLHVWLLVATRAAYSGAEVPLEEFLTSMGRRKYAKPLYEALIRTPAGRERAIRIYRRARPGYHPITVETVDTILSWEP